MNRERCPQHDLLIIPALGKCGRCAQLDLSRSAKGRARQKGGATKEELVGRSLAAYRARGEAVIVPVPPPIVGAPGRMRFAGTGPVDRVGRWAGMPTAFDIKGVTGRSSYEHDVKALHQLSFLLEWTFPGDYAVGFLLLVDSTLELMWIIADRPAFQVLLGGGSVPIRRSTKRVIQHQLPVVHPETDLVKIAKGAPEYDFLGVLQRHLLRDAPMPVIPNNRVITEEGS